MSWFFVVVIASLLSHVFVCAESAHRAAASFQLEDQWGKQWSSAELQGKPYVLILADRDGAASSQVWGRTLAQMFQSELVILGSANLEGVPFFLRWFVRIRFRERATEAPILLDWEGSLCRFYTCRQGIPTVIVVNPQGVVVVELVGEPTRENLQTIRSHCIATINQKRNE